MEMLTNGLKDDILKFLIALLLGAIVGAEREYRSKSAGLRTMILVCCGACIFTIISQHLGAANPDRIAANIITGIGFLGAGVIFKEENRVNGITTATAIWMVSALGMSVGAGYVLLALLATFAVLMVLVVLKYFENFIEKANQLRNYKIVCVYNNETLGRYETLFKQYKLKALRASQNKVGDRITGHWLVQGRAGNHEQLIQLLLTDPTIEEFDF